MYEDQIAAIAPLALHVLSNWRGKGYPLSRTDLAARCNCDDRTLRAAIAELRRQGYLIVADKDGGYRFASSWADVERFLSEMKSRITAIREIVESMERTAAQEFGPAPVAEQMRLL